MEKKPEELEPQNPPVESAPKADDVVTIPKAELDDIKHKAEVSSQNFERLKKAEQDNAELEQALEALKDNDVPSEDERVKKLETELKDVQGELAKSKVLDKYPVLKDLQGELDAFRADPENKGMNLQTAAKAFLTEKGLLEPTRKGVEKGSGGPRQALSTGMSDSDIKNLRETNYKKYREMVIKGQIKTS